MLKKATEARAENPVLWNNLGAQYLEAKNYREAAPALEKAVQLQPSFAKAFLNLGSAYRGLKEYDRAQASYQKALQLFPNYADAVFHIGILYLDADKVPNMDTIAKLNTAIGHFQRYKQMMGGPAAARPIPSMRTWPRPGQDRQGTESASSGQKKQEERERQRQSPEGRAAAGRARRRPAGGAPRRYGAPVNKTKPADTPLPPSAVTATPM